MSELCEAILAITAALIALKPRYNWDARAHEEPCPSAEEKTKRRSLTLEICWNQSDDSIVGTDSLILPSLTVTAVKLRRPHGRFTMKKPVPNPRRSFMVVWTTGWDVGFHLPFEVVWRNKRGWRWTFPPVRVNGVVNLIRTTKAVLETPSPGHLGSALMRCAVWKQNTTKALQMGQNRLKGSTHFSNQQWWSGFDDRSHLIGQVDVNLDLCVNPKQSSLNVDPGGLQINHGGWADVWKRQHCGSNQLWNQQALWEISERS